MAINSAETAVQLGLTVNDFNFLLGLTAILIGNLLLYLLAVNSSN